ncbi:MAG TPA: XdhC family protein [Solirubrobacteraceae bacterium]|nr:XdhC family protein [Solirubrobacteraceae bacterium]
MSVVEQQLDIGVRWLAEPRRVVCALLVDAEGSSPFAPGAFMLIDAEGAIEGSITGGCVESDVVVNALEMLEGDAAPRLLTYGVSDAAAHEVGLMCGGTVDVFVHELDADSRSVCAEAFAAAMSGQTAGIATLLDGPAPGAKLAVVEGRVLGGLHGPELLDHSVTRDLTALSERGTSALRHYGDSGAALGSGLSVHLHAFRPAPQLVLIGAIDYSAAVAALARQAGYEVLIADAREAFARSERFSRVATVHIGWPAPAIDERQLGPRDAVIVFSHDSKFDEPAILAALRSEAGYIGALGSHRTARDRRERLLAAGASEEELERVHSPCGLDIGAATPEEVAISIMAEVIAARSGRAGRPLIATQESIRPR